MLRKWSTLVCQIDGCLIPKVVVHAVAYVVEKDTPSKEVGTLIQVNMMICCSLKPIEMIQMMLILVKNRLF